MEAALDAQHHLAEVMSTVLLFFAIAGLVVPLWQRLGVSAAPAYLLCGVLIGPYGLAAYSDDYRWLEHVTISRADTVQLLGEFGIIALMFMIGLELSLSRLRQLRRYILGLGSAQIILSTILICVIAHLFGNSWQASIVIGASLALSSTAMTMKLLEEHHLSTRPVGVLCFSVLLMQDLAVVPILLLVSAFTDAQPQAIFGAIAKALVYGALVVLGLYVLGRRLLAPLLQSLSISRSPEWLTAFVVFIVLGCALMTQSAGLSVALGAFMAGLLVADTAFRHEVEVIVTPMKGLLLGMFFLSVGMLVDVREVMRYPDLLLLSVLGIYALKAVVIFPLCRMFGIGGRHAAEIACYLSQPGEFALVIFGVALSVGLMPAQDVQFFLLLTSLAMSLTPVAFRLAPLAGRIVRSFDAPGSEALPDTLTLAPERQRVLIAGLGRVGQLLATALEEQQIPYLAFDHDAQRVQRLKRLGLRVMYGDARKKALWVRLGNAPVSAAVVAIDSHESVLEIVRTLRAHKPDLPIIVRSKDVAESTAIYDAGADHVVAETLESSLRIARLLLQQFGQATHEIDAMLERFRAEDNTLAQERAPLPEAKQKTVYSLIGRMCGRSRN